ncbi:D-alanyl-D-alanine carboxypeptidase family protein [Limibacillus halophilus]|uniref:serine-type D-Ala-D-Ala carboxypeptidase n=1 Tax=Limibacillus halophilus TaxID=1579333 RepID=A0A839SS69_9PROT|nr:D-alanyl-D-alanine carboxypeptidase family protein [Limibacillus halophilus]MBB3065641.1 D-alanyl-D-alanine carboxypeptidase (penicillin-binding protein 5/6) [Limibacillus halophilus]
MQRRIMNKVMGAAICLALFASGYNANALETSAREGILIDLTTNTVLLAKDADEIMPPASMSKIMTIYLVFEALKQGRLQLDDELSVSEKAWRMGGSKMFVEVGNRVPVEALLRGVIVQSGNDACVVLAEALGGTEEAFAEMMNRKARELGMTQSNFANATGWPDPNHYVTARELALLAQRLIQDFPEYYHYFAETEYTWNDITQQNRNPLLYRTPGTDGLKTGHTEEAGYGLTASAVRNGRRILLVANGMASSKVRAEESDRLIEWAFREFESYTLFNAGETVERADVWMGQEDSVELVSTGDIAVTLPKRGRDKLLVKVVYDGPVPAPIERGQIMAHLVIEAEGMETQSVPLMARSNIDRQGPIGRLWTGAKHMILGSTSMD